MTDMLHDPGNTKVIDDLYVFMSIDEEGRHGIVASILPNLGSTPMVTASEKVLPAMKAVAQHVAAASGKNVGLFKFKRAEQLWQSE